ncbi:MAG TPA: ribosome biogenesis GTPase Der [Patescibacteria group bacterium]|jgi:GTP-binding protein|nr:ribosome biogenesis GTPase Der [Patescibacteria group bacterium]
MPVPRVAIVGAPNVGKSTLFNRLVGRRKALVHREPGMTRDVNEEPCDWNGRPVTLVDTGGLFAPGDSIFADLVRKRVLREASRADVLLFLVDSRRGLTSLDEELGRIFRATGRQVFLVVNKLDVPGREDDAAEFFKLGFPDLVAISAEHGLGLDELYDGITALLPAGAAEEQPAPSARGKSSEIRLAIAGRPNVGKSSLLNALMGEDRSLVSEVPGTTRDSVDCLLTVRGHVYRIIDTAGIRRKGKVTEAPESLSVMTARRNIEGADVVLFLMDATEGPTQQDLHVAGVAKEVGRPFIVLLNKWDLQSLTDGDPEALVRQVRERLKFAPFAPVLTISALTGMRIDRILPLVDEVHEQASRRLSTGRLNNWLRSAVAAHRPPAVGGRDLKFFYIAQKGSNPPAFVAFTNLAAPPHFSYQRYLENSLREQFGLSRTPVILQYRERPRRAKLSVIPAKKSRRRPV